MTDPRPDPDAAPTADPADEILEGELVDGAASDDASVVPESEEEISIETLVTDLERLAGERDQFLDAYRRTQADFENFRKQSQRRQDDHVQRMVGGVVERLLPVLDACDGALQHGATEVEPIAAALLAALEKEGLARIEPIGEPFDPTVSDAVVHEPGDGGEHIVSEVLRPGYTWQGRVLRPAMVKVTD
ncbi:MAG: nucleotide exchange factor GrpE [Microthrixaceae bacterium]